VDRSSGPTSHTFAGLTQLKLYPAEKIETYSDADLALRALADHEADTGNVARVIEIYQELLDRLGLAARNRRPP
jgi:hypothetical protein